LPQYRLRFQNQSQGPFEEVDLKAEDLLDGVRIALARANGQTCELWQAGRRLILIDPGEVSPRKTAGL
jgi:hypothetical protein